MLCVTPLYGFRSDSSILQLDEGTSIIPFSSFEGSFDETPGNHFQACEPTHLLLHNPDASSDLYVGVTLANHIALSNQIELRVSREQSTVIRAICQHYLYGIFKILTLLRLFKPGTLKAGETFFLDLNDDGYYDTVGSGRASSMNIDPHRIVFHESSYVLDKHEIQHFGMFKAQVIPFFDSFGTQAPLHIAIAAYGADEDLRQKAVVIATGLEALITKADESEGITYRLGIRIANLLGSDAEERKRIFFQVKKFYGLRSKIVHGDSHEEKILRRLDEVVAMKEILRRVLLSVMALTEEKLNLSAIPDTLDQLAFDHKLREDIQTVAMRFMHLRPATVH